jgi:hypothetical protein
MQFGSIDNMMVDCKSESSACRVQVRACIPVTTLYEFKIFDIFKKSAYSMVYIYEEKRKPPGSFPGKLIFKYPSTSIGLTARRLGYWG